MTLGVIQCYQDFCAALRKAGFSLGGDNDEGIFSLCSLFGERVQWHTGDPETDPWAWRMRVLHEEQDIGYGKYFYCKGGFITREWAPCFLALRRSGSYLEAYEDGQMSLLEKNICQMVEEKGEAALHELKAALGAKGLESALARLQTGMYLTISGQTQRLSRENMPYGWPVTVFRLTEDFWSGEVMAQADSLFPEEARDRISAQVRLLNPQVESKALERFLE